MNNAADTTTAYYLAMPIADLMKRLALVVLSKATDATADAIVTAANARGAEVRDFLMGAQR